MHLGQLQESGVTNKHQLVDNTLPNYDLHIREAQLAEWPSIGLIEFFQSRNMDQYTNKLLMIRLVDKQLHIPSQVYS